MNTLKTSFLLASLTALLGVFGWGLDQFFRTGHLLTTIFLVGGVVMNWASWWYSDRIVLSMYGAEVVDQHQAPELYSMVQRLSQRAGLPMPKVAIIPMDVPNAFATGRDPQHGVVAVTSSIMRILSREELEGVIAHELGHIKNRDTLISTVAATIAGVIGTLASAAQWGSLFGMGHSRDEEGESNPLTPVFMLIMAIVAPIIAMLLQMAVSRTREYGADRAAAEITGNPGALASALLRLENAALHGHAEQEVRPGTQHMFIVNPLTGGGLASLFSTHPATEDRIAALQKVAAEIGVTMPRYA